MPVSGLRPPEVLARMTAHMLAARQHPGQRQRHESGDAQRTGGNLAALEPVGHHAGDGRQENHRHELHQPQHPEQERRALFAEVIDLTRDLIGLRADHHDHCGGRTDRNEPRQPDQAVVTVMKGMGTLVHAPALAVPPALAKAGLARAVETAALARAAQARVGLQGVDHLDEVIEPDDPFELEACALRRGPDQVRLDPADDRTFLALAISLQAPAARAKGSLRDVQHIVVLMQENRSFDHLFGALNGVRGFADRFPIPLPGGRTVWQQPAQDAASQRRVLPFHVDTRKRPELMRLEGTPHRWPDAQQAWDHGRLSQWPASKEDHAMAHFGTADLPFHVALANAFTLCDAYHCSFQGGTWPNRLFL